MLAADRISSLAKIWGCLKQSCLPRKSVDGSHFAACIHTSLLWYNGATEVGLFSEQPTASESRHLTGLDDH